MGSVRCRQPSPIILHWMIGVMGVLRDWLQGLCNQRVWVRRRRAAAAVGTGDDFEQVSADASHRQADHEGAEPAGRAAGIVPTSIFHVPRIAGRLLVTQRLHGIETRSFVGGPDAEEEPDADRHDDA